MQEICVIEYSKLNIVWVSSFYDIPLKGICKHKNSLCEFQCTNDWTYEDETIMYHIYKLSIKERIRWLWRKFLFEQCVGYHCTYNNGKRNGYFYYRYPQWLYKKLCNLYYGR